MIYIQVKTAGSGMRLFTYMYLWIEQLFITLYEMEKLRS